MALRLSGLRSKASFGGRMVTLRVTIRRELVLSGTTDFIK